MKTRFVRVVALLAVVILLSKCTGVLITNKGVPPGQVKKQNAPGQQKKAAGAQSAKEFAPGQQKKKK